LRGAVVAHACALAVRRLVSEVSVGSVGAWGNSTTHSRVAGGRRWVGSAGCSALRAWRWVRCIAAGVTPRAATMFGMDTPATIRNKTISRSGLGSVAISAGSRAQCLASTHRWLGPRESGGATGAGVVGGRIGGGATDIRSRAPLPGSAAVLVPRIPVAGLGCRPWDPVGSWPTGVCAAQPTSASHAGRDPRGQCGAIGGDTGARRDRSRSRRSGKAHGYPPTTGLGAGRRALVPPGSGACATDSSRVHRFRKPLWLIKVRLGTKEPRRTGESYPRFDGEW